MALRKNTPMHQDNVVIDTVEIIPLGLQRLANMIRESISYSVCYRAVDYSKHCFLCFPHSTFDCLRPWEIHHEKYHEVVEQLLVQIVFKFDQATSA